MTSRAVVGTRARTKARVRVERSRPESIGVASGFGVSERLREAAEQLGFVRASGAEGDVSGAPSGTYRMNGFSLHERRDWVELSTDAGATDPLGGAPDDPGLWRRVPGSAPAETVRTFEITPAMLGRGRADASTWRSALEWAIATADGRAAPGWRSPDPRDLAEWIPRDALTIRAGTELRQGRVVHDACRLAIELPWLTSVAADLPASRRAWIDRLLLDAQRTWRLVRVCREEDGSVVGSIDLTGAPPDQLPTISRAALDALRWVTSWIVPPAALLTDLSVESRLVDAVPSTARLAMADVLAQRGATCTTTTRA